MNRRPRSVLAAALGVLALAGGTTACTSTPGNRRVVTDLIEGFVVTSEITESEGACMHEKLADYDDNELSAIADANENISRTNQETWGEDLQDFRDDYAACLNGETTESGASSEPEGTEPTGTEPPSTTES